MQYFSTAISFLSFETNDSVEKEMSFVSCGQPWIIT